MNIFKCPHCEARYELIVTHVSFRQRSYATCQVCWKTMYSWDSARVPRFTLIEQPDTSARACLRLPVESLANATILFKWGDENQQ